MLEVSNDSSGTLAVASGICMSGITQENKSNFNHNRNEPTKRERLQEHKFKCPKCRYEFAYFGELEYEFCCPHCHKEINKEDKTLFI